MGIVYCSISGGPKITHLKPPYFRLSVSSFQWRLRNSTTMMFNCLRDKPLYCDSLFTKFINLWLLTIFTVNFFHPSSSCKTVENEEPFFPSLSPHSRTDCCEGKKGPHHRRLRWIKYCPAGVCYQGCCLSVFQCVPQELPSILPLCAAQIAYFARTRLRIKLCHVLHAQTWDFLCLLWTPCHVLVLLLCWFYKGFF